MRKLLICMMLLVAVGAAAKGKKDDSKYLKGAVPEVNGMVTFTKSFSIKDKSEEEVHQTMLAFVNGLVEMSIEAPGKYARLMGDEAGDITARICEWMTFVKKPFVLDRARFRYQIKVTTAGQRVSIAVSNISYYYNEDMETNNGRIIKAEDWITDSEALNKSQTKLYPISAKFRRKTVDRMEELFEAAMDAFENEEPQKVEPVKPVRKSVVEE